VAGIEIRRIAGHIGAEVTGADLSVPDADVAAAAWRAMLEHKVVFFRGQHLDHAAHVAFARRLGPLLARHGTRSDGGLDAWPEVLTISPQADQAAFGLDYEGLFRKRRVHAQAGWHTDMTNYVNPPAASVLRAGTVPELGGDTQWVNLAAAYAGLSGPVQRLADGLSAEHDHWSGYQMRPDDPADAQAMATVGGDPHAAVHPVVAVHPETGERALFVSPARIRRIIGLDPPESRHVLGILVEQATRPEYTVRWRWEPGDVALWDNRATAHVGPGDFDGQPRVMYRVTIAGGRPVGPDGFTSQIVTGRELAAGCG
jgi:alpha-ketoglutarate-dependent sulfate ester dioxygenase